MRRSPTLTPSHCFWAAACLSLMLLAAPVSAAVKLWPSSSHTAVAAGLFEGHQNSNRYRCAIASRAEAKPRHALQPPRLLRAPERSRNLLALNSCAWNLKHKLSGSQSHWDLQIPLHASRPVLSRQRRFSAGCPLLSSIRPPPSVLS